MNEFGKLSDYVSFNVRGWLPQCLKGIFWVQLHKPVIKHIVELIAKIKIEAFKIQS